MSTSFFVYVHRFSPLFHDLPYPLHPPWELLLVFPFSVSLVPFALLVRCKATIFYLAARLTFARPACSNSGSLTVKMLVPYLAQS